MSFKPSLFDKRMRNWLSLNLLKIFNLKHFDSHFQTQNTPGMGFIFVERKPFASTNKMKTKIIFIWKIRDICLGMSNKKRKQTKKKLFFFQFYGFGNNFYVWILVEMCSNGRDSGGAMSRHSLTVLLWQSNVCCAGHVSRVMFRSVWWRLSSGHISFHRWFQKFKVKIG